MKNENEFDGGKTVEAELIAGGNAQGENNSFPSASSADATTEVGDGGRNGAAQEHPADDRQADQDGALHSGHNGRNDENINIGHDADDNDVQGHEDHDVVTNSSEHEAEAAVDYANLTKQDFIAI